MSDSDYSGGDNGKPTNYCLGYSIVAFFCVISVVFTETTQIVDKAFDQPYIVRYLNMVQMIILFIPIWIWQCIATEKKYYNINELNQNDEKQILVMDPQSPKVNSTSKSRVATSTSPDQTALLNHSQPHSHNHNHKQPTPISLFPNPKDSNNNNNKDCNSSTSSSSDSIENVKNMENIENIVVEKRVSPILPNTYFTFIKYTLGSTIFQNIGGLGLYIALDGLSVPTAMALAGLRGPFCYILAIFFLGDHLSCWKVIALGCSLLGVACYVIEAKLSSSDSDNDSNSKNNNNDSETRDHLWAIIVAFLANLSIACNDVFVKKCARYTFDNNHKFFSSLYLVCHQGLLTAILAWILLFYPWNITNDKNWDKFTNNQDYIWLKVIILGITLTLVNVAAFGGMVVTSPVFVNVGVLLAIPLSYILDIFVNNYVPTFWSVVGAILLILAFLMLKLIKPPKCLQSA